MAVDLPKAVRNPISLIGVAVATAMAVVFLLLLTLEFTGQLTNPYAGLLVFVAVPFVFVIGLLLIPIGIWRQRRRVAAGHAPDEWPVIDLRLPRTRSVILGVGLAHHRQRLHRVAGGDGVDPSHGVDRVLRPDVPHDDGAGMEGASSEPAREGGVRRSVMSVPGRPALSKPRRPARASCGTSSSTRFRRPCEAPVHSMPPARETCSSCHSGRKAPGRSRAR